MKIIEKIKRKTYDTCMSCKGYKKSDWYRWNNIYFNDRPKTTLDKICRKCAESVVGKNNKKKESLLD